MKKKILSLLLVAGVVTSMLAGCGSPSKDGVSSGSGSTQVSKSSESNDSSVSDNSDSKVKLTALFVAHPLTKSPDEMQWVKEIADKSGVEIQWEVIYQDWDTTKSTRFASGDIPDLLFNGTSNPDYATYNGMFQDMSGLIQEHAPNIQAMFDEEPNTKVLATTVEGQINGIPKFQGKWPETNTVLFLNQQWMDNLDLKMPTTFSQLKEILKAFKEKDANGNGNPDDEIPMDFNAYGGNNSWFNSAYSLTRLLGSMGVQITEQGTNSFFLEDFEVKSYAVDPRYKLFIEYLSGLYSEGLINGNAITNDYSAFQSLSRGDENGDALVGCVFGWEETDKFGPELYEQYVAVPPLEYDIDCEVGTYETLWAYDYDSLNMAGNRVSMSAKCENQEAAMRFIDAFYDETTSVEVLFGGIADGCVEQTGDNTFKVLPPLDPETDSGTWKWTNSFADNGPMYIRKSTEIEMSQDMENALEERKVYKDALAKLQDSTYYPQMFMKYSLEDENTLAMTQANINNIIDNYWSLWLTGESDINADWDTYVKNVEDAGLKEVLAIRQAVYDEYRGG